MRAKCFDNTICLISVPYSTLILLPNTNEFKMLSELEFLIKKKKSNGCVIEVPSGTVIRIKRNRSVEYFLLDNGLIKLRGVRAKIIGYNSWGYHYVRTDTNETVLTVVYINNRFIRVK
ncbi:MAG: hypothetical protein QXU08_05765 [Ignisphaera sp.]